VKTCSQGGILMKKPHTVSVGTWLTYGLPGCDDTIWFGRHLGGKCCFHVFLHWRWRQSFILKQWYLCTRLYAVPYQKIWDTYIYLNIHQAENLKSNIGNTAAFYQKHNYKPVPEPTFGNMWSLAPFHLESMLSPPPPFNWNGCLKNKMHWNTKKF
jgi:hypothetical protein